MRRGSRRETWWRGRRSISNSSKAEERPREERAASTLRIVSVWIPITRFILPLLLHLCVVRLTLSSFQKETCWAGVSFTTRPCPYRYYGLAWNGMSRKKTARTRSQERPQDLDRRDHLSFSLSLSVSSITNSDYRFRGSPMYVYNLGEDIEFVQTRLYGSTKQILTSTL